MRWSKAGALATAVVAANGALAGAGPDEVRLGGQVKKTVGVVKSVEAGDIACYLNLVDARGAAFTEMADFELCAAQPPLTGRRGETVEKQGVVVEKGGETIAYLPCVGPVRSELGPDWFERSGDEEFFVPE